MADKEEALRALQNCFQNRVKTVKVEDNSDSSENGLDTNREEDEDSINLPCALPHTLGPGVPSHLQSSAIKKGWLEKTPPKGTLVSQKRWVTLDAQYLRYYQNEKEVYSKRIIAVSTITDVLNSGEQRFELVTKNRTFVFRAESNVVREEWVAAIKEITQTHYNSMEVLPTSFRDTMSGRGDSVISLISRQGYLEEHGTRSKLYVVIYPDTVFLYRNLEEHNQGIGITSIDMNMGSVKSVDKRAFNLITRYRTFSFVAESMEQREEWEEAMQACIGRSLSSNAVVWRIWAEESNQQCADCGAPQPDWASVNLCVILCRCCAGVHRGLGQSVSKVRSLKMDEKVWTDSLIQVFLLLGNDRANLFWAANMPPSEALCPSSGSEERGCFITAKYCQGKYRRYHELFGCAEALNKALCKAVQTSDLLETLSLVFCGADVNCFTGDPKLPSPMSIAQHYGQRLQVEFLAHNLNTEGPGISAGEHRLPADLPSSHSGSLLKTPSSTRAFTERKAKGEFSRRWCSLDQGIFSYYESEKSSMPSGTMKMSEVQCLVVSPVGKHGYTHTFELYHNSGRVYLFGSDFPDAVEQWIKSLAKALVPPEAEDLACWSFERLGRLRYTEGPQQHCPRLAWLALGDFALLLLLHGSERTERINLRKLQELCVEQEAVVLVERARTVRVEGDRRPDFQGWVSGLQQGLGRGNGPLDQQQLTNSDIPVIVDRCLSYVTQYGMKSEGVYRKAGVDSRVAALLVSLCHDARRVQLREGQDQVDDVANTLKRFLRNVRGGVFSGLPASLPWLHTVAIGEESVRITQYQALLQSLPLVYRATLAAVINHLYCVQYFADENHMNAHNLAIVFGPTLFQTDGTDKSAGQVVEDLVRHYQAVFHVEAGQLQRQLDMISSIMKAQEERPEEGLPSPLTICAVYLEVKDEASELLVQVAQKTVAKELVSKVLRRQNITPHQEDYWSCFLVNETEEMERPLHYQEEVLPIYFSLGKDCHLVVKRNNYMKAIRSHTAGKAGVSRNGVVQFCEKGQRGKGHFIKRLCVLSGTSLKFYKTLTSHNPERECLVVDLKVYCGIRKKLQPPSCWGVTIEKGGQKWYLCYESTNEMIEWLACFMFLQHEGDLWPADS